MLAKLMENVARCDSLIKSDIGIYADFSRQKIRNIQDLLSTINPNLLQEQIQNMFDGEYINTTEDRAALHVALRIPREKNMYHEVWIVLDSIEKFCSENEAFTDIVVIGIGGSYLGTLCVHEAIKPVLKPSKKLHFVSNVDPINVENVLETLDLCKTLFIVISKTFTTSETMMNAKIVKEMLIRKFGPTAVRKHMVAVSSNTDKVIDFGIDSKNIFHMWDWVGGRFSVWSAVGMLPLSMVYGFEVMKEFLEGGHSVDEHFSTKPFDSNIPVIMGLTAVYNTTYLKYPARAILPYSAALSGFVPHVQQLSMESNGKHESAGELIFGEPGTNGQHSFYQLLHQGRKVPCDFIGFTNGPTEYESSHAELLYNFLAQADALALQSDRPSTMLLFQEISPYTIGQLIALYEHQTVVQGFVWGINSFDQPAVEFGKKLVTKLKDGVRSSYSTDQIIKQIQIGLRKSD